jgi:hypothetical protein
LRPNIFKSAATFASVAFDDFCGRRSDLSKPEDHLREAEAWLCRAQAASRDGGVSYGYSLRGGWRPSYPETSGYIATTFLRLAAVRDRVYSDRAYRILNWLISIQNPDGSFSNPRYGDQGIVFDTGQVLFGLAKGAELSGSSELLASARRAARWLTDVTDSDLRWTKNEHLNVPHVYNTRTAWALLRMNQVEFEPHREAVARSNLDWAVAEQHRSGFFHHCSFEPGRGPFTHTLAYTARGLIEAGILLNEPKYIDAGRTCAEAALLYLRQDGHLPSIIWPNGESGSTSCCLTGNCQFAIIWSRLFQLYGKPSYFDGVVRALDYVMRTQNLSTANGNIRGAIKGSNPIWGRYAPMSFPNWATKFFVDAMWLRKDILHARPVRNLELRV